jgi:lipid-A-disaccharide synthase
MLTAVESSADEVGARLMRALRSRLGAQARFVGVGGPSMAAEGLASAFDPSTMAVVGAFNAIAAYPTVLRRVRETAALARRETPDVAVLIDAWGFSIRVAKALRAVNPAMPLVKYVAPQVWATRPGRARTLARAVDRLLTIHAFDPPWFEAQGLRTVFVGNPALSGGGTGDVDEFRAMHGFGPDDPILLILPGSRAGEVKRLMPRFADATRRLKASHPGLHLVLVAADSVAAEVDAQLSRWTVRPLVVRGAKARSAAMKAATVALACSGTVTTELALAGRPMVVAYRLGPFTYMVAQMLIRTPYITLLNVAANRFVAPERVQGRCTGAGLARDLAALIDDPARRLAQVQDQAAALEIMRGGIEDPIAAAADAIVDVLASGPGGQPRASSGS